MLTRTSRPPTGCDVVTIIPALPPGRDGHGAGMIASRTRMGLTTQAATQVTVTPGDNLTVLGHHDSPQLPRLATGRSPVTNGYSRRMFC